MNPRRITVNGVDFDIATPEQPGSPVLAQLEREADHASADTEITHFLGVEYRRIRPEISHIDDGTMGTLFIERPAVSAAGAARRDELPDMVPEPDRATACGGVLLPLGAVLFGLAIVASILVVGS